MLKGGAGGFLQWILQVTNPMKHDERTGMLDALTAINERWIKTIDDYHFPVVTLSGVIPTGIAAPSRRFEAGLILSSTARL